MKVCSIASGSSGNCTYIGDGKHHILIDAGISRKRIVEGLKGLNVNPEQLDAIFVTHEHIDHVQGIYMMAKGYEIPIYATGGTLDAICLKDKQRVLKHNLLYQVYPDETIRLGEFDITPFSISHDAADPVCYTVVSNGKKFGSVTDLGVYDQYIVNHLEGSDVLFLEANHDISMLEAGKYAYSLKRRILGKRGHLSNEAAGTLLCQLLDKRLKYVFLAHLSKENNYPELAYEAVKCQMWEELGVNELPFEMYVADRFKPSQMIVL